MFYGQWQAILGFYDAMFLGMDWWNGSKAALQQTSGDVGYLMTDAPSPPAGEQTIVSPGHGRCTLDQLTRERSPASHGGKTSYI